MFYEILFYIGWIYDLNYEASKKLIFEEKLAQAYVDRIETKINILAKNSSPWTRGLYYLTGKKPSVKPEITRGYSSSVPDAMFRNAAKGRGTVEKSITTRSGTTNLFGDNSQILREVFKDYITRSEDGAEEIIFQNVPKDIIKKWNEKYGEKLHMHIDPKTKTMDNWIYVKGKRNSGGN